MSKPIIAIILGSDSDLPVVSESLKILEEFNVSYEIIISSAHRSPEFTVKNVEKYHKTGVKVIIAAAGLAAHLAGVIAAHFPLPVIGIPLKGGALAGVDSLYSTVQMPPGIPVATVGIDAAKNAALLAIQILAVSDKKLEKKMIEYKKGLSDGVEKKTTKIKKIGWKKYLESK
ncbi:5-(carboxyamino)imidazole ribonucleotide mutase [Patescibacteria group bacterium]|nr:5-(carboxyamino)imidazole ribonucleotide mutase [Patescibacteria group bacterium]